MADQVYIPKPGLNHVGSYQVSSVPFLTGALTVPIVTNTPLTVTFPSVTKRIIVHVLDTNSVRVGFSSNGVKGTNYFLADGDKANNTAQMFDMNVRGTKLYLLSNDSNTVSVCVAAELTGITGYDLATIYSGSSGIG